MFKFIKSFLKKEEPEVLSFNDLNNWLDNKLGGVNADEFIKGVESRKVVLYDKLGVLEKAEVEEKYKVEGRVRNIVIGQRDNYVKELKRFLDDLNAPDTSRELVSYVCYVLKQMKELGENTAKSYQATTHLFFKQVQEVFKLMQGLHSHVDSFNKNISNKGLDKVETVKNKLKLIEESKLRKETLEREIEINELKLEALGKVIIDSNVKLNDLNRSVEFNKFNELRSEREEIVKILEDEKSEIHLFFSQLQRPLRKYFKITLEMKLLSKYLEAPEETALLDHEFKILDILNGLKKSILSGEVELDKGKEKVLALIEGQNLKEQVEKIKSLLSTVYGLDARIKHFTINQEVVATEKYLVDIENKMRLLKKEIERMSQKLRLETADEIIHEVRLVVENSFNARIK